jgi:ECF transporter S component (folate family)
MQKNEKREGKTLLTTKTLVFMALMVALSIVLGKFLAINITDMIRISLENLPILLCAIVLGPIRGAIVALVADLLGCFLRGYAINPIVTIGAVVIALICGIIFKQRAISSQGVRVVISVLTAHIVGSSVIKTIGLASFYLSSYDMGFGTLFIIRLSTYILTAVVEIVIITLLLKSKPIKNLISKIQGA